MLPFRSRGRVPNDDDNATAEDLAARARAGDPEAENELVKRYRPGLLMMIRKRLKDPALADDYCQEVFRVAFEAIRRDRLEDGGKLAAYLWSVARNLASSDLRRHYRHQTTRLSEAIVDDSPPPEQVVLREESARLVREALSQLTPRDRGILAAFYLDDVPKEVICRKMGLSPSQFDVIKWRALRRLQAGVRERESR
jgi:RNA polymerase sigma-70 factor (ECF subfamily)